MKYDVLTDDAKKAAQRIASAWENGELNQYIELIIYRGDDQRKVQDILGAKDSFLSDIPPLALWLELGKFNFLEIKKEGNGYNVLLMQELRNAVASDFNISDYYLPWGSIAKSMDEVVGYLYFKLGDQLVESNAEIKEAIESLKTAPDSEKQSRIKRFMAALVRSMDTGSNAAAIITAMPGIATLLGEIFSG